MKRSSRSLGSGPSVTASTPRLLVLARFATGSECLPGMGALPEVEDRVLGCLLGGAIGDAIGGPYENRRPPFSVAIDHEWRLSDDTQLTLATCEAIVAGRGRCAVDVSRPPADEDMLEEIDGVNDSAFGREGDQPRREYAARRGLEVAAEFVDHA